MAHISISKGLNLPFKNIADEKVIRKIKAKIVCLDLSSFFYLHLKLLKGINDNIIKGEKIASDVHNKDRFLCAAISGKIIAIHKGERNRITSIIVKIETAQEEISTPIDPSQSKEALMSDIIEKGLSFSIHKRPFHRIINKNDMPRSIFINTITSSPYTPSYRHIYQGNEKLFQAGVDLLTKFSPVHLFTNEEIFFRVNSVETHKATGPHPIESPSIHISAIDPITSQNDVVWSLDVYDILQIGSYILYGVPFTDIIVALTGNGLEADKRILIKTTKGIAVKELIGDKKNMITGNPLTGALNREYLREKDTVITTFLPKNQKEILPFIKLGLNKSTVTKTYLGGFFKKRKSFSPPFLLGGEERPFILKDIYQGVFPFNIYIEPLIKALLAQDYEMAISLGFLEIDTEDLALCEYICPSKISFMAIFSKAKKQYLQLIEK